MAAAVRATSGSTKPRVTTWVSADTENVFRRTPSRLARWASAEERCLAGHTALFPDAVRAAEAQLLTTEALADLAVRLAELDGVPAAEPADPDVISTRAIELVADLVEPAKSTALEKLGERERARMIATGWLRAKLGPSRAVTDVDSAPDAPTP